MREREIKSDHISRNEVLVISEGTMLGLTLLLVFCWSGKGLGQPFLPFNEDYAMIMERVAQGPPVITKKVAFIINLYKVAF